jgi:tetratricopeptide (TPR) repeat protein
MNPRVLSLVFTGLLFGLAGCAQDDQDGSKQPYVPPPPPTKLTCNAKPGLTTKQRVVEALGHLETRDEYDCAEAELNAILQEDPGHRVAADLKEQLTADPQQYVTQKYGGQSFKYSVKNGESISLIAKRYMGNTLKFVILARYNDIDEPKSVNVGTVLRIPGKASVAASTREPLPPVSSVPGGEPGSVPGGDSEGDRPGGNGGERLGGPVPDGGSQGERPLPPEDTAEPPAQNIEPPAENLDEERQAARDLNSQGRYEEAISLLEQALWEAQPAGAQSEGEGARSDLADYYAASARQLRSKGKYGGARLRYEKAIELVPYRDDLRSELFEIETSLLPAQQRLASANDFEQRGDLDRAYEEYGEALKLNPNLTEAADRRQKIGDTLKDSYYREAVKARLQGDLDLALKNIIQAHAIDADDQKIQDEKHVIEQDLGKLEVLRRSGGDG